MAAINTRADLSQGSQLAVAGAIFATGTGADIRIHTSAANNLPALAAGEFFEVRDHANTLNNGLFQVVTVNTSTDDYEVDKVSPGTPVVAGAEAITTLGATGASTEKSIHFDVAALEYYVLEQGNVTSDGVEGGALYSFTMQEWKDDNYLIGNAKFPLLDIDSDAGKYFIGQNAAGTNTGWVWKDDAAFSIRTRKLLRNMGWDEIDSAGITQGRSVCVLTVDVVADPVLDTPFYLFGTDTTLDNTTDFTFPGPINEAVEFYREQAQPGSLAITATTVTRGSGSWITEGYVVGGQFTIRAAEDAANNGTWGPITALSATVITIASGLTVNAADTAAILAVNNGNLFKVGMRERGASGKTFAQANLTTIQKSALSNFIYQFPLGTGADDNITETDGNMDINSPYTGMTLTFHSTPQARAGLVGGSFNFGIIGDANGGTHVEFYEWLQYQLRKLTDIDADADTAIGRSIDLLASFVAGFLQVGSANGGLSFPTNPDGGGSGMFVDDLAGTSDNAVKFWDNTGTLRSKPETVAVTIDGNDTAINDTDYEYDLIYDRTKRTNVTDFVLTNSTSKITSAGSNLPSGAQIVVNAYIRIESLAGGDAAMNGIYQINTITTPGADWTVTRYDGATIVDVTTTAADVDENPIDSPDNIIVWTNTKNIESGSTITYTAPDTVSDSANGFSVLASGDIIEIVGSTSNDGIYEVDTAVAGSITLIEQTISTEASSSASEIYKLFSGLFSSDVVQSYDFDGNDQGGRAVSTTTYVQARGVGLLTGQYASSTVASIASQTPVTIPLTAQIERNVV